MALGSMGLEIGKGIVVTTGNDVSIISCGTMVDAVLDAEKTLRKEGISVRVIDMHTIKPIDTRLILRCAKETNVIVTAEEHSIIGGLGSAVAETLIETGFSGRFRRMGINDMFCESGDPKDLLEKYKLNGIVGKFMTFIDQLSRLGSGNWVARFISYGNASDINEADCIEYLGEDEDTKMMIVYLEDFKNGRKFIETLGKVSLKKPVMGIKANRTETGAKAGASHTAALSSDDAIVDAINAVLTIVPKVCFIPILFMSEYFILLLSISSYFINHLFIISSHQITF